MREEVTTHSPEETMAWGEKLGRALSVPSVVCLTGNLAAGKTTLAKGIAASVSGFSREEVQSPTFVYLNIYEGKSHVFHFDLYRLQKEEEFYNMGFDEYFDEEGICLIEWSERIPNLLPKKRIHIICQAVGENSRKFTVESEVPLCLD